MKIAFLDHPYHRKTRSSDFFKAILESDYELEVYYPGGGWRNVLEEIAESEFDLAVCWQHEFFAPYFTARGIPSVIIPMFDGSGVLPREYWQFFAQLGIRSINFSSNLHEAHLAAGMSSYFCQYFPNPEEFEETDDFSNLRGFFWERSPHSEICKSRILELVAGQLDQLHVHAAPDADCDMSPFDINQWRYLRDKVTVSQWFEKREDYFKILNRSNVYFAPRPAEGIGMTFLEAMASGKCVVAHDYPTMNEYIEHGKNGFLYRFHERAPVNLSDARRVGRAARKSVFLGYETWLESVAGISSFLNEAKMPKVISGDLSRFCLEFPGVYFRSISRLNKRIGKFL